MNPCASRDTLYHAAPMFLCALSNQARARQPAYTFHMGRKNQASRLDEYDECAGCCGITCVRSQAHQPAPAPKDNPLQNVLLGQQMRNSYQSAIEPWQPRATADVHHYLCLNCFIRQQTSSPSPLQSDKNITVLHELETERLPFTTPWKSLFDEKLQPTDDFTPTCQEIFRKIDVA